MDGARPGCDRFKSLSNGVETDVVPTPVATMPVIANTGATLLIGHEAPGNVSALAAEPRPGPRSQMAHPVAKFLVPVTAPIGVGRC
jgi:hypothetical protein